MSNDLLFSGGHPTIRYNIGESLTRMINEATPEPFIPFNQFNLWYKTNMLSDRVEPGARPQALRDEQRWARKAFLQRPSNISKAEWAHGVRMSVMNMWPEAYKKFQGMKIQGTDGPISLAGLGQAVVDYTVDAFKTDFIQLSGLATFEQDDAEGNGSIEFEYKKVMFDLLRLGVFGKKTPEALEATRDATFSGLGSLGVTATTGKWGKQYVTGNGTWISRKITPDPKKYRRVINTKSKSRVKEVGKAHKKKGYEVIISGKYIGSRKGTYRVFIPRIVEGRATEAFKVGTKKKGFNLKKAYNNLSKKAVSGSKWVGGKLNKGYEWMKKKAQEGLAWIVAKLKEIAAALKKWGNAVKDLKKNWDKAAKARTKASNQKAKIESKFKSIRSKLKLKGISATGMGAMTLLDNSLAFLGAVQKRKVFKCKKGTLVTHKGKKMCRVKGRKKLSKAYTDKLNAKLKIMSKINKDIVVNTKEYGKQNGKAKSALSKGNILEGKANSETKRLNGLKLGFKGVDQLGLAVMGIVITMAIVKLVAVCVIISLALVALIVKFATNSQQYGDDMPYEPYDPDGGGDPYDPEYGPEDSDYELLPDDYLDADYSEYDIPGDEWAPTPEPEYEFEPEAPPPAVTPRPPAAPPAAPPPEPEYEYEDEDEGYAPEYEDDDYDDYEYEEEYEEDEYEPYYD